MADIVGPIWYEEKERDAARETQQVVRLLGIQSGMTIADIGAGSGYYVVRIAPIVGPGGHIFAEDVVPDYLRALRKRLRSRGVHNVTIVLGEPHDARLPAHSLDRAILVHMYHEIAQPYGLVYNLVPAFKPGARLGIVDSVAPTSRHGTPPNLLRCELAAVGYREIAFHPLRGSSAYLAIFAPPSEETAPVRKQWSRARRKRQSELHVSADRRSRPPAHRSATRCVPLGACGQAQCALS